MKCPICEAWSTVKATRESPTFGHTRRRECANYHMFTTQEIIIPQEVIDEERKQNLIKASVLGHAKKLALQSGKRKTFRKAA